MKKTILFITILLFVGLAAGCGRSREKSGKPQILPTGRILFVVAAKSGQTWQYRDIYIINVDGTEKEKLARVGQASSAFSLSPDGKTLAYFGAEDYFCLVIIATGEIKQLVKIPQKEGARYISWSPDGEKIAFVNKKNLHVVNVDGSNKKQLARHHRSRYKQIIVMGKIKQESTEWIEDQIRRPIWSTDGEKVFFDDFMSLPGRLEGVDTPKGRAIRTVDLKTEKSKIWLSKALILGRSPTQDKILCCKAGRIYDDWHLANKDGEYLWKGRMKMLTKDMDFSLLTGKWTPDGSRAVLWFSKLSKEVEVVNINKGANAAVYTKDIVDSMVWSPDSQHAAYSWGDRITIEGKILFQTKSKDERVEIIGWLD